MTVLPELEQQLVRAAAAARPAGVRHVGGGRRRIRSFIGIALGFAVAVTVVVVFAAVGARKHPQATGGPEAVDPSMPATYARACATTFSCLTVPPGPLPAALRRPFYVPELRPGERCPTTAGTSFNNSELGRGLGLGSAAVRADIGNAGDLAHGRIVLGTTEDPGWDGIKTVWYSVPSYRGPWSVRAVRLSGAGRIDLGSEPAPRPEPGGSRFSPTGVGVAPGDTINTAAGVRTDPRTTWISRPGCYAFQVDGLGFSELIVFQALAPAR